MMIPATFVELKSMSDQLDALPSDLLRLKVDQRDYEEYTNSVTRQEFLDNIKKKIGHKDYALIPNKYPYTKILQHLPHVLHLCLWSKLGAINYSKISEIVNSRYGNNEWFSVESSPGRKSVPEIWHVHIFVNNTAEK